MKLKAIAVLLALCLAATAALEAVRLPALPLLAALQYTGADGDNVNHGSAAVLDDHTALTWYAWIFLDANPTVHAGIITKLTGNVISGKALWTNRVNPNNLLRFQVQRATTPAAASGGNIPSGAWAFVALTYDESDGARAWLGSLTSAVSEVAASVGSGATSTDASANLYTGNRCPNNTCNSESFPGRIAVVAFYSKRMTQAELDSHRMRPFCSTSNGCILFSQYWSAAGAGTQPDLSGNGNNGTVTGATSASHVPIGRYP